MEVIEGCRVDFDYVVGWLKILSASRVLIQSPLGLRKVGRSLGKLLDAEGFVVFFSSSNCWGGCDIAYSEASSIKVDAILHLGHSRFLKNDKTPTMYVECRYADETPLTNLAPRIVETIRGFRSVGLGASVQWLDHLQTLASYLSERGISVSTAEPEMYAVHPAQVLGCDATAMKKLEGHTEAFIVVGSVFHGLGVALLTNRPTFAADPHTQKFVNLSEFKSRILMQRYANIEAFRKAKNVGVLVSLKPGQKRLGLALRINRILRIHGRQSYIISSDEITSSTVLENGFEGFVNTACPRLSIEDQAQFSKPVLLPAECLVALGLMDWGEVVENGLLMYPWGWTGREAARKFWGSLRELKV
ncbi:MAG: diphthamide biosynthesis enzyme Dph2 [Candidatus Caldarchaeum sp.]|nr:diphthamide biosynthesis enzyme Dph2 [Candidatus Caldarchaeum sp.]MDW8359382.1 diphthamide biosynthesis enzyme Dph2 [Candidatus Caldarchaeum sp.]